MKLKTLALSLTTLGLAVAMTACDNNNDSNNVTSPDTGKPKVGVKDNSALLAQQKLNRQNQALLDLNAIANNNFGKDRCSSEEYAKDFTGMFKSLSARVIDMKTEKSSLETAAGALDKKIQNAENQFCGLNLSAFVAKQFLESVVTPSEAEGLNDEIFDRIEYLVQFLLSSSKSHQSRADIVFLQEHNGKMEALNNQLSAKAKERLSVLEDMIAQMKDTANCSYQKVDAGTVHEDLALVCVNGSLNAYHAIPGFEQFIKTAKGSITNFSITGPEDFVDDAMGAKNTSLDKLIKEINERLRMAASLWDNYMDGQTIRQYVTDHFTPEEKRNVLGTYEDLGSSELLGSPTYSSLEASHAAADRFRADQKAKAEKKAAIQMGDAEYQRYNEDRLNVKEQAGDAGTAELGKYRKAQRDEARLNVKEQAGDAATAELGKLRKRQRDAEAARNAADRIMGQPVDADGNPIH